MKHFFTALLLLLASAGYAGAAGIHYVKDGGSGDGSSWSNAAGDLQEMVNAAAAGAGDEIWVAAGTYKPNRPANNLNSIESSNRDNAFVMKAGVKIYGGFPADALDGDGMEVRSWRQHPTVLSGDLSGNDIPGNLSTNKTDNAYHVVLAAGSMISGADTACLDGFVVAGGYANGSNSITVNGQSVNRSYGGGIYSAGTVVMRFANDSVAGCYGSNGGGVYIDNGSPAFTNALVSGNAASSSGGGVYVNNGNPAFTNALVSGNTANSSGGGVYVNNGSPAFTNATIAGNYANNGGGVHRNGGTVTLRNSIVGSNNASGSNKNIYGDGYSASYSLVHGGGVTGEGVITGAAPLFAAPDTAKAGAPTAGGDYHLHIGSFAIDAGSNALSSTATDLDSAPRVHGYAVDMGAYESSYWDSLGNASGVVYVSVDGAGNMDGSSWSNAHPGLAYPLYFAQRLLASGGDSNIKEIWVSEGTYRPADIPTASTDLRDATFAMAPGVKLYGGFPADALDGAGMEVRGWRQHPTVLSGDLNGNDIPGNLSTNKDDNAYHVVLAAGSMISGADTACLDGFVVTGGYANTNSNITVNGQSVNRSNGGGIYSAGTVMRFANDSVTDNRSSSSSSDTRSGSGNGNGGGVYVNSGSPNFTNVLISGNTSSNSGVNYNNGSNDNGSGGGVYVNGGSPAFTNALISGNTSSCTYNYNGCNSNGSGGGVYVNSGSPNFTNVLISGNTSSSGTNYNDSNGNGSGGGVYVNGGSPAFTNALISGNTSSCTYNYSSNASNGSGGGVYVAGGNPAFTNATIAGNYANNGGGVHRNGGTVTLRNSIVGSNNASGSNKNIYGDGYSASYSLVHGGGVTGEGVITGAAPLFAAPDTAKAGAPTAGGDYHLHIGSFAIDAGSNALSSTATDLDSAPRVHGYAVDMGAYESSYWDSLGNANGVVYVSVDGAGNMDGSSWSNAHPGLAYPLYFAQRLLASGGDSNIKEIWVSEGTYRPADIPTASTDLRDATFAMAPGVKLYGGFPADALDGDGMEVRGWRTNLTVLSGDLSGNDIPGNLSTNKDDNAYHVVLAAGSMISGADTACLDGFVVTGGYANTNSTITVNGQSVNRSNGGGIYSAGTVVMQFANDSVAGCYGSNGGGVYIDNGSPAFTNALVSGNTANSNGGGVYVNNGTPAFTNALVSGNTSNSNGGGVYVNSGNPAFTNALVSGNTANSNGGGVYVNNGSPAFTNATIAGNYANNGGGVHRNGGTVTLRNSIVGGNNASGSNKNTYGDGYSASYSLVHGGSVTGTGVITNAAPLFVSPDTAKAGAPSTGGDYHLQPGSFAIDVGSSSLNSTTKDLDGNPRVRGYAVDMGAYESYRDSLDNANGVVYVSVDGAGNKDGSSWSNAYPGLAYPLYLAQRLLASGGGGDSIKEIWVSEGTYRPADIPTTSTDPRDATFAMAPGVKIYGGFPADATDGDGMEARGWRQHPTVLSGDLSGNDIPGDLSTNKTDNAYHVVLAAGSMVSGADTACLDGFVVAGGYANGSNSITVNSQSVNRSYGGGIYSAGTVVMRFANDSVADCYGSNGGGVYIDNGSPAFTNALVSGNTANSNGGGVYVNNGTPAFTNALVSGNTANSNGGGVYVNNGSPAFTNATIAGNYANNGGGVYRNGGTVTLRNSIVGGNNASGSNKNIYGDGYSASYSLVHGGSVTGTGVITGAAPLFVSPDTAKAGAPTAGGNYRLQLGSFAIDVGSNALISTATDLDSAPRVHGCAVDMGAYESSYRDSLGNANGVVYVSVDGAGNMDGSSWSNAHPGLAYPLYFAQRLLASGGSGDSIKEIWVSEGTYRPADIPTTSTDPRDATFVMKAGVKIYGGFPADALDSDGMEVRGWRQHPTVLSGDLSGNDTPGDLSTNKTDNAYHVVLAAGSMISGADTACLDGFVVTGGYANGGSNSITVNSRRVERYAGGGIYSAGTAMQFANDSIAGNYSSVRGGGIYSADDTSTYANIAVSGNTSDGGSFNGGGGVYVGGSGSPAFTNVRISGNTNYSSSYGGHGGGMFVDGSGSPAFTNVRISGNTNNCSFTGSGGGVFVFSSGSPAFTNVSISGNTSTDGGNINGGNGGGVSVSGSGSPTFTNVRISGNTVNCSGGGSSDGGGVYVSSGTPTFTNALISGNTNGGRNSNGGGVYVADGNPAFTNATIAGNYANNGGGVYRNGGTVTLRNSIVGGNNTPGSNKNIYGDGYSASYSLVHGGSVSGTGVITGAAPLFAAPDTAKAGAPTAGGDYHLQPGSFAIDAGSNDLISTATDLDSAPRVHGCAVDMGAYESSYRDSLGNANGVVYVSVDGAGNMDGSSWSNAHPGLAYPLYFAQRLLAGGGNNIKEIWVSEGTYRPADNPASSDNNRDNAFVMKAGVKLYGGFPADALDGDGMEVRNWRQHPTVLSGDLNGNDISGNLSTNKGDNAYHVVLAAGSMISGADTACLDGFVVAGGYANGSNSITVNGQSANRSYGGGIYSAGTVVMRFANDSVTGCYGSNGGGVYIDNGSPAFTNALVSGNTATGNGGGVYVNNGNPAFTNALVSGNTANSNGGGVYVNNGSPAFTNATIAGNYANNGGGVHRNGGTVTLRNSIVGGNNASGSNKNIYGDGYSASYSLVHGGSVSGTGVITNAAPLFVSPDTAKAGAPTAGGNYRLQPGSFAIDVGSNALISTATDLDSAPRVHGCAVDMGAYESSYRDSLGNANGVVYVSVDGAGNKDGSSWSNAYPGLVYPLYFAQRLLASGGGGDSIKEIWVSEGTYRPALAPVFSADPRDMTFAMAPGVKLYGGFPADATDGDGMEVRSWRQHPTVLSGDLSGNDIPGNLSTNKTDNAYHVVLAAGSMISGADTACLDGFVVAGGYANGSNSITVNGQSVNRSNGGGIYSAGTVVMRFANDSVAGCYGSNGGGGVYIDNGSPAFTNALVSGNTANSNGGGVYVNSGNPAFTNALVSGNTANSNGGGVYVNSGNPAFTNATIAGNYANNGGGVYVAGGNPAFTNALVSGNTANSNGGGVYVDNGSPAFTNATIAGNYAKTNGGGVYRNDGTVTLRNSIVGGNNTPGNNKNIYGDGYSASYSLVQGGSVSGTGVVTSAAPLFVSPDTAKATAPTAGGNYHLQPGSFAIDAGSNALSSTATDLDSAPRVHGYAVDMGAYESSYWDSLGNANGMVYVSVDGAGNMDGSSWSNAHPGLAYPLYFAQRLLASGGNSNIKEIWVSEGTYRPADIPTASTDPRDATFAMAPGVKIYGGFPADTLDGDGMEVRGWRQHPTVLSGDLSGNDIPGNLSTNKGDNAYHVVLAAGSMISGADTACLDGFVVTGGYANTNSTITVNGQSVNRSNGGGIYSAGTVMRFANDSVTDNRSSSGNNDYSSGNGSGGGVYVNSGSPNFTNVLVSKNTSSSGNNNNESHGNGSGGGVYVNSGSPAFTNALISGNTSSSGTNNNYSNGNGSGGGVYVNSGSPAFTNALISGNTSSSGNNNNESHGNGSGGGVYVNSGSPAFTNALISGNTSSGNNNSNSHGNGSGGGVYNNGSPNFTNVTIAGNYAGRDGGGVYRNDGTVTLRNSIVGGNNASSSNKNIYGTGYDDYYYGGYSASYSLVYGGSVTGTGVITNAAPLFVSPDTAKAGAPSTGGNYHLQLGSFAIDVGSSSLNSTTKDLDGNPRVHGYAVDMGAYESSYWDSLGNANGVVYVSVDGAGNMDGSSWSNAYPGLAYPLYLAQRLLASGGNSNIKEIWVSEGTYRPALAPTSDAGSRDATFAMAPGVKIYGGFPADALDGDGMEVRGWRQHPTVLSGDLSGNDIPGNLSTNKTDNAYHVVLAVGSMVSGADTACLDGFVVTGGYANTNSTITVNGQSVNRSNGGGIYSAGTVMRFANDSVTDNCSSSSINNDDSNDNNGNGGGVYVNSGSPNFTNVLVSKNTSSSSINNNEGYSNTGNGGGVYVNSGFPNFTNVLVSKNISSKSSGTNYGNSNGSGGGVYVNSGSPNFTNVLVSENTSSINTNDGGTGNGSGGGVCINDGSPNFTNALISENTSLCRSANNNESHGNGSGGGVYVNSGSPNFTNALVSKNTSSTGTSYNNSHGNGSGGGVCINGGSPAFTNALISGNNSSSGALNATTNSNGNGSGGGVCINWGSPAFTNALISGNTSSSNSNNPTNSYGNGSGGGVYNNYGSPNFTNATIAGNYAGRDGGGVYRNDGTVTLRNSIVGGNNASSSGKNIYGTADYDGYYYGGYSASYSLVQGGGVTGEGVITVNPLFVSPAPAGAGAPTAGGDYHLQPGSFAIDAGSNDLISTATDLDSAPRVHGYAVDMGAYESSYGDSLGNANGVVYVSVDGAGNMDGSSWSNAHPGLAYPLYLAQRLLASGGNSNIKEIWVSEGTYRPADIPTTSTAPRDATFAMTPGVKLYGGFPADATDGDGMEVRGWRQHPTVLSGDLNGNDIPGNLSTNKTDNAYHVVLAVGSMVSGADTACLDGFVVTGGYANSNSTITVNGQSVNRSNGGGIYSAGTVMRFANDSVTDNRSSSGNNDYSSGNGSGGGVYVNGGSPNFTNVLVSKNTSSSSGTNNNESNGNGSGGGVYVNSGSPAFTNALISGNTSSSGNNNNESHGNGSGGGVYVNSGSPAFTNALISGNTSSGNNNSNSNSYGNGSGGGVYNNGSPNFTNVTIAGNYAGRDGGGVYRNDGTVTLRNSIVGGNNASGSGKNIYGTADNDYYYGGYSASYSLVQGGDVSGTGVITNADPLFVAPDMAKAGAPTAGGDYHLQLGSFAIDAGSNALSSTATDLDSAPRVHGYAVDMGAYESSYWDSLGNANGVVYVSVDGAGNMDGSSWSNAHPGLAYPLYLAQRLLGGGGGGGSGDSIKEIWVSEGTYRPADISTTSTASRDATFAMAPGVKLYGGFPADATDGDGIEVRGWRKHPTVLSGDLNGNDIPGNLSTNKTDNAYHVVLAVGSMVSGADTACLDGFVVTGGYANTNSTITVNGQSVNRSNGGGIYSVGTVMRFANDSVTDNCSSSSSGSGNNDDGHSNNGNGGGVYVNSGSPNFTNVLVSKNTSSSNSSGTDNYGNGSGGGVYVNSGSPNFTNVLVSKNTSSSSGNNNYSNDNGSGGGVCINGGSPNFTNALISGNTSSSSGTNNNYSYGNGSGGGVCINGGSPAFTNALISGNTSSSGNNYSNSYGNGSGGGVYNNGSPNFTNVTIAGNYAGRDGGGVYRNGGTVTLRNSIVGGNNASGSSKNIYGDGYSASYSLVQGGDVAGEGVITGDPLFVSPDMAKAGAPVTGGDYHLQFGSPAIDAGSNDLISTATDLDGKPRVRGVAVDMGAYESYVGAANGVVYVSVGGKGRMDGSSWDNAYPGLAYPLHIAQLPSGGGDHIKEIWVSEGTYRPAFAPASNAGPRDTTFAMAPGVKLYGGFPAGATDGDGMEARNWRQHPTVLSGDLSGNDIPGDLSTNKDDNAYHVVVAAGSMVRGADTACLDGFVVTGGYANDGSTITVNGQSVNGGYGGGIYSAGTAMRFANDSVAGSYGSNGGGVYVDGGSPAFTNVRISGNAGAIAGGVYVYNSSPAFTNALISGNTSGSAGGGVYVTGSGSTPAFTNATVAGNYAGSDGGGVYRDNGTITLRNSIVGGNNASGSSKNIYGDGYSASYSLVHGGGVSGTGVITGDPLFASPDTAKADAPTTGGDYRLQLGSPAIDACITNQIRTAADLDGKPRVQGCAVDMGAYESPYWDSSSSFISNAIEVVYVSAGGRGSMDGSSWSNAYPDLAYPLHLAPPPQRCGVNSIKEIWVSEGTYRPAYTPATGTDPHDATFAMAPGVKIYGGFPANAANGAGMEVRGWRLHPTVLSGDLNGDDTPGDLSTHKTDNAYHVVLAAGSVVRGADTACLDGFVVTGGYANTNSNITVNSQNVNRSNGGGIYSAGTVVMQFANDSVAGCYGSNGGGVYVDNGSPAFTNALVSGNTANSNGGGAYVNNGNPAFTNVCISGNTANSVGGGVYVTGSGSTPAFTSATVAGNYAGSDGGGVYRNSGTITLRNSIVGGNNTPGNDKNIYGDGYSASYSLVHGGSVSGTNVVTSAAPLFVAPDTAKSGAPTVGGDYRLQPGSPAIDAGSNDLISTATDLDGNPRVRGYAVDMGAYESYVRAANGVVYVSVNGKGRMDGSSWDNAYPGLAYPLHLAQLPSGDGDSIKEIWVSEGTYRPAFAPASDAGPRDTTFAMAPGVKLYGGFPANAANGDGMEARNWRQHPTVLSGDLSGNDVPGDLSTNKDDNAYHVVLAAGSMVRGADTACLDGFVVTGGYANDGSNITVNGRSVSRSYGGGIYSGGTVMRFANDSVAGSYGSSGGGVYVDGGSPAFSNVLISGNTSSSSGGGVYASGSTPAFTNVRISGNAGASAGGVYVYNSSLPLPTRSSAEILPAASAAGCTSPAAAAPLPLAAQPLPATTP